MESAVERHVRYAETLILQGTKPTVDLLVAHLGGSRTTAQKALTTFWAEHLPKLLATRGVDESVPQGVRDAVTALWRSAMADASAVAAAELATQRREVEARATMLEGAMSEIAAERAGFAEVRAMQAERIAALDAQLAQMHEAAEAAKRQRENLSGEVLLLRERLEATEKRALESLAALTRMRDELAETTARHAAERQRLEEAHGREKDELRASAAAEREAMAAAHAEAMGNLKQSYVDRDADWMRQLDAARTTAKLAEKARDEAREALSRARGQIEELREGFLDDLRKKMQGEEPPRTWRRPSLRRPSMPRRR